MMRQKGPDPATLARHGVTSEETTTGTYRFTCETCRAGWNFDKARRLPPYYWLCPEGCNAPAEDAETTRPARSDGSAQPVLDLAELPAVLTPAEAAQLLRVSVTTVKDWARAGDLPGAFKLGKEWRVERDALLAYIRPGLDELAAIADRAQRTGGRELSMQGRALLAWLEETFPRPKTADADQVNGPRAEEAGGNSGQKAN